MYTVWGLTYSEVIPDVCLRAPGLNEAQNHQQLLGSCLSWFTCRPLVVYPFTPILLLVYHYTALVCNVFMHSGFTYPWYYIGNSNT